MDPNHIPMMITRRSLLRGMVLMVGGAATTLPVDLWARAHSRQRFLNKPEFALLDEVCDIILPQTDTPGARDAGVPGAFDALLRKWADAVHQQQFRALLETFDAAAVATAGEPLLQLEPAQRIQVITAYDAEQFGKEPYTKFKTLVLRLYYVSEIGATQELRYEHVPGAWEPDIKLGPETRAWAGPNGL